MPVQKEIIGKKSRRLKGKRIALCITGSVGCIRSVEIARDLIRYGADVFAVMNSDAQALIGPSLLEWATGNSVVTKITGKCEHLSLTNGEGKVDIVLVAPSTANTIAKCANGICDSPVSLLLMTAIGAGIPVMFVPAMHDSLYNDIFSENVKKLERFAEFVPPLEEEGKKKMPASDDIVYRVIRRLGDGSLRGKKVVVTAGATREYLDDIRFISNRSTGRMGIAFGKEAWLRGADVTVIAAYCEVPIPRYLKAVKAETIDEMGKGLMKEAKRSDIVVTAAGVGDFEIEKRSGKIKSGKELLLKLSPAKKIVDGIKRINKKCKFILFKAESGVGEKEMIKRAVRRGKETRADIVIANDERGFGGEVSTVVAINGEKARKIEGSKEEIASAVFGWL